jgi:hypothetical protein
MFNPQPGSSTNLTMQRLKLSLPLTLRFGMCSIPHTCNGSKSTLKYKYSMPNIIFALLQQQELKKSLHNCCNFSSEFLHFTEWEDAGKALERIYVTINPQEY